MRDCNNFLVDINEAGKQIYASPGGGFLITPDDNRVTVLPPGPPTSFGGQLKYFFQKRSAGKWTRKADFKRTASPEIPAHWEPLTNADRCPLDQQFDCIFYLFADCPWPGTFPLNFMIVSN